MSTFPLSSASPDLSKSRGWLIFGGILSILVGFMAMGSPLMFSIVIAQLIGIFALVSGCISLSLALFGKHATHRVLGAILALIRIAAGVILLRCVASSIAVITLILAIFLIVEGVSFIIGSLRMRDQKGWIWTLINGIAALALGLMIYAHWPSDSAAMIGLLYGINSLFWGMSLLMLGFAAPKPAAA